MSAVSIPAEPSIVDQKLSTVLTGATFQFRFRWNPRSERWLMDVMDVDGNQLANGIVVGAGVELLYRYTIQGFPFGEIIAPTFDSEIGLDALSKTIPLVYLDS